MTPDLPGRKPEIALVFDVDWVTDEALELVLRLLNRHGVRATLFATHRSPLIDEVVAQGTHEVGIHPNFLPGSTHGDTPERVMDHLLDLFPRARGVRAHQLVQSTPLHRLLVARNLDYDATLLLWMWGCSEPFIDWTGLVRIPCTWEDDCHLDAGLPLAAGALPLSGEGLHALVFHPIHIFLNSPSMEFYRGQVARGGATGADLPHPGKGIRTVFEEVLVWMTEHNQRGITCSEIARPLLADRTG